MYWAGGLGSQPNSRSPIKQLQGPTVCTPLGKWQTGQMPLNPLKTHSEILGFESFLLNHSIFIFSISCFLFKTIHVASNSRSSCFSFLSILECKVYTICPASLLFFSNIQSTSPCSGAFYFMSFQVLCMSVCEHVHVHVHVSMRVCMYMRVCIRVHVCLCVYVHAHVFFCLECCLLKIFERLRQEDWKFKACLGYRESSMTAWVN